MACSSSPIPVPPSYATVGGLRVHPALLETVKKTICPGTGFSPQYFWKSLEVLTVELRPEIDRCLERRDQLQERIDAFYQERKQQGANLADSKFRPECVNFLKEIGYLEPDNGPVSVATQFVDAEIAQIPAPQLVVPSDNARYVLNAVNARWGSLFDALYGFDVIPATAVQSGSAGAGFSVAPTTEVKPPEKSEPAAAEGGDGYNPRRGEAVIEFANGLLDEIAPLAIGRWHQVVRLWPTFVGSTQQLEIQLQSGARTSLQTPGLFIGSAGNLGPPDPRNAEILKEIRVTAPSVADKGRIFLKHNGLHLILEVDKDDSIGSSNPSGIKDITVESALSVILDMEDSVSAVDGDDKAKVYQNICGVLRGGLVAPYVKDGKALTRRMRSDIWLRNARGEACTLPGRAVCLIRNVGHHMFTDAVLTEDGRPVPEGFLDCLVSVASGLHDLRGTGTLYNSRTGSLYIVKPKMHGPQEVALTSRIFSRAEEFFGLRRNTIKMGIMDEERRTSTNLRECLRAASERVFFINTGFLDRTGDEIHTCMLAGPVVRKADIKQQNWIRAYEDSNVDVGLYSGMQGKGQIGKGMWAKPDNLKAMLESKISEVLAGASTAWVPSPSAAALHSIHYHRVDVPARQMQLAMRPPVKVDQILEPPLLPQELPKEAVMHELRENAQSILGYVVRWIDLGVGCSKVPDLSNVGLMEDRATLRISSQLVANWVHHGLVTEAEVREVFKEMAKLVDQQNASDRAYRPMSGNLDSNVAFQAALELVLAGRAAPNGYTEPTLHAARKKAKAASAWSRL
mmetsp:Transcript_43153/g.92023  ORF Transcript_43153/g.92023 Transcript_43153/m.92023 type:complete len:796 (-) Transcript_43153:143-2530(-)